VTVRVSAPDDHSWQLRVEDTGIGMPPDAADYIFDPFQQVDGSSTRKYRGTGLGVASVTRLIEQMGGSIEVETELGQGSAFNIILPTVIIVSAEPLRQSS
jgi:signal transduction histidine kinase